MKRATLTFPIKDNEVLLGIKVKKVAAGLWNGYGGKIEEGQTPEEAGSEELFDETGGKNKKGKGIKCDPKDLIPCAVIDFYFPHNEPGDPEFRVIVYITVQFTGEPEETKDEMLTPTWFDINQIPYDKMMAGDRLFIPKVLAGEKFVASITFDEEGNADWVFKNVDENSLVI